jgi:hypothetical protein
MTLSNRANDLDDDREPGSSGKSPSEGMDAAASPQIPAAVVGWKPTSVPFAPGTTIGLLRVVECSPERFVLTMRPGPLIALSLLGTAFLILGPWMARFALWWIQSSSKTELLNSTTFCLVILPALAGFLGGLPAGSFRYIGYRLAFDGPSRCVTLREGFRDIERIWDADELEGLECISIGQHWPIIFDSTKVTVVARPSRFAASFGMPGQGMLGAPCTRRLAKAAVHAAAILGLPLYLDTSMWQSVDTKYLVETVRSSPLYRRRLGYSQVGFPFSQYQFAMATIICGCGVSVGLFIYHMYRLGRG